MKGYRTIVTNVVMAAVAMLAIWGIEVDAETQTQITTGIIALIGVVNLVLRTVTTTPVGKKE